MQKNKIPGKQKPINAGLGSLAYANWIAWNESKKDGTTWEFPLLTDATVSGECSEGYGPYQFFNMVPPLSTYISLKPHIMLRYAFVISQEELIPEKMEKTDDSSYHGGGVADEFAALISLHMGIRIKAGKATRRFDAHGDPRGKPIAWAGWNPPLLLQGERGVVIPWATGQHQLTEPNLIMQLPNISAKEATVLIKAARFYQEALWIAESSPELSWIMMVSAIETVSDFAANEKSSPEEIVNEWEPDLITLLNNKKVEEKERHQICKKLAKKVGSTRKFTQFLMDYLPSPPLQRPAGEWAQLKWEEKHLKYSFKQIYNYRSRALHGGTPFPWPMCQSPYLHNGWNSPSEIPIGLATSVGHAVWNHKDTPMLLHMFEYIVRHVLCSWWKSILS